MARGDPAFPLENLVPYLRGARFGVTAMRVRHGEHDLALVDDAKRFAEMTTRFEEAAKATFRLRREKGQG